MGVRLSVQPMLAICSFRITELHYTYGCQTLIKAYVYERYVQNHWVTLQLWVHHL